MPNSALLSDKAFQKILDRRPFPPDSVIFKEGDRGLDAYIVLRGTVDIVTKTKDGKLTKLRTMKEGELFGEMSLLNNSKRSAHALSTEGCELLVINQTILENKLKNADPFIRYWIEFLIERVLDVTKRISG